MSTFISYAQNREDVVLHRVLEDIGHGRYVDVGANDPTEDSVSRAFYDRGWRGITVEPVAADAQRQREERPEDIVVEAAANDTDGGTVEFFEVDDSRLSTLVAGVGDEHHQRGREVRRIEVPSRRLDSILAEAGWGDGRDIHFLSVDTEGAEQAVLSGLDLHFWRPWVIVVEATKPQTTEPSHEGWEPLLFDAGYRFGLFDGLSRFYLAQERWAERGDRLRAPANVLDTYVTAYQEGREVEVRRLLQATTDLEAARQGLLSERELLRTEMDQAQDRAEALRAEVDQERARAQEQRAAADAAADLARASAALDQSALVRWRSAALGAWSAAAGGAKVTEGTTGELQFLRASHHAISTELDAIRRTVSWRVTAPLRSVRRLGKWAGR